MILKKSDSSALETCATLLLHGKIVILPTDTVYGFSGIVEETAQFCTDKKIRTIKGREAEKPFIQLISHPHDIFAHTDDTIPRALLDAWPGALTLIVNDKRGGTTAYRCPGDAWLRAIVEKCGAPVYSTSVNVSGKPVMQRIQEIIDTFAHAVDLIVDDGNRLAALPSTIVSVVDGMRIVRQGCVKV
ncbi:MAG: L-threonylcarbamoyladenylate synthase [Treponema sp.]|nr:L-threonylcarbamoyladenylate synthase [Treponema sp.]